MPENKKHMEHESDCDTNSNWHPRNNTKGLVKGTGITGNKRTRGNNPDYIIIKISWNNEKSAEDLRRLVVSQTPVKNHKLTLVWKTLKGVKL